MNPVFSLLVVFLTQLFMPRHNAQLQLLKAQIQILRTRIPTQRIAEAAAPRLGVDRDVTAPDLHSDLDTAR